MRAIEINGKRIEVISSVDAVGLFCPMPVVKLKVELEKVKLNDVVELLADDAGVCEDLPAWCNETGNKLLSIKKTDRDTFAAYVEKKKE